MLRYYRYKIKAKLQNDEVGWGIHNGEIKKQKLQPSKVLLGLLNDLLLLVRARNRDNAVELLEGNLRDGALEPVTGRQEPRRGGEDEQETNCSGGVVEELHINNGPGLGQVEDNKDEGSPNAGNPTDGLGPRTEVELALNESLSTDGNAEQDGDGVRGGKSDNGDTGDSTEDGSRSDGGQGQNDNDDNGQPDEAKGHLGALVEDSPVRGEGETTITGKGVEHARVGSDGSNTTEETSKDDEEDEDASSGLSGTVDKDLGGSSQGRETGDFVVLNTKGQGKGQAETNADGGKDRHENAAGSVDIGLFGLLGHVG